MRIEEQIKRKGLELGFTHVGIAPVSDYPEFLEEAENRPNSDIFTAADDSLIRRISETATRNPKAKAVVCATFGFAHIDYPHNLVRSVARAYLSRTYTPPVDQRWGSIIEAFAQYLEDLGLEPDRNQFNIPQRLACAQAGIITRGYNNFAYTPEDGSYIIMVTFLVNKQLEFDEPTDYVACPPDCNKCVEACPTGALYAPGKLDLERCILFNNQRFQPGAQQEIWDQMGMRIHGCDICQEVCPRNHEAVASQGKVHDYFLDAISEEFDLEKILTLNEECYERNVRPIMYNYIKDMDIFRRNAAVALGNSGDPLHIPALKSAMESTDNDYVRDACAWAIDKLSAHES